MELTDQQIQELYKFTRKHYVYYYDVQSELVDHLANDIEEIWEEYPKISFEDARDKSFKKFGIFGFMDVVEAKEKQMHKRYWKIIWRFAKEWFTIPKVLLTVIIFISVFLLLNIPFADYIILSLLSIAMIFELIAIYKIGKKQKHKEVKKEKIFLLEAMIGTSRNGYSGFVFINLFNFVNLTKVDLYQINIYWQISIALLCTLLIILFQVSHFVLPQKTEELLQETYPEYKMTKSL
jgi:hypothetical protein